jgi:hypothetical protein
VIVTRAVRFASIAFILLYAPRYHAQQGATPVARLVAQPTSLTLKAGDTTTVKVTAYDANGKVIPDAFVMVTAPRRPLSVSRAGQVRAIAPGKYDINATTMGANGSPLILTIPVTVTMPALARLEIVTDSGRLYTGITLGRQIGFVTAHKAGRATISADAGQKIAWRRRYSRRRLSRDAD